MICTRYDKICTRNPRGSKANVIVLYVLVILGRILDGCEAELPHRPSLAPRERCTCRPLLHYRRLVWLSHLIETVERATGFHSFTLDAHRCTCPSAICCARIAHGKPAFVWDVTV